jgi:hypothetical protein
MNVARSPQKIFPGIVIAQWEYVLISASNYGRAFAYKGDMDVGGSSLWGEWDVR